MPRSRHAVVVGASAAGVGAALAMRESGFDGTIDLVDADPNHPYERPPLSKSLLPGTGGSLTPIVPASTYSAHDIGLRLGVGVRRLDRARGRVVLTDGDDLPADTIVLATGASPRRLTVPGADLENVMVLRDAGDAAELAVRSAHGGPVVLVGGGYIGLELAAVLRALGIDVTVVDVAPLPLATTLGPVLAHLILDLHLRHGVRFVLGSGTAAIHGAGRVEAVELTDGTRLPASTVIVGVGVVPNVALARDLGIGSPHGIPVSVHGSTGDPWVWAAGDVAIQENRHLEAPGRIEHWDTARRHGEAVGAAAAGRPGDPDILPYVWSEQYGLMLQSFGRPRLRDDDLVLRGGASGDGFAAFWLRDGRVAAVTTFALPRESAVAKRLVIGNVAVDADVLRDPSTDLRAVLKAARATAAPAAGGVRGS